MLLHFFPVSSCLHLLQLLFLTFSLIRVAQLVTPWLCVRLHNRVQLAFVFLLRGSHSPSLFLSKMLLLSEGGTNPTGFPPHSRRCDGGIVQRPAAVSRLREGISLLFLSLLIFDEEFSTKQRLTPFFLFLPEAWSSSTSSCCSTLF